MSVETNRANWTEATESDAQADGANGEELPAWAELLEETETVARDLIRAHPVAFVIGAAVLGFAVARLVRDEL